MSLWWVEGFEAYGATNGASPNGNGLANKYTNDVSGTMAIQDGRYQGKSVLFSGTATNNCALVTDVNSTFNDSTGKAEVVLGFAFKTPTLYSGQVCSLNQNNHLPIWGVSLHLVNTGAVAVGIGDGASTVTIHGTSGTTPIQANSWHYIEFKVHVDNAGSYEVLVDGVQVLTGSADTLIAASLNRSFTFNGAGSGNSYYLDDIYALSTDGSAPNNFLGDRMVVTRFPSANGATINLTPLSGNNYENVDDNPADGNASYNSGASGIDIFEFGDIADINDISAVAINVFANRPSGSSTNFMDCRARSGGTSYTVGPTKTGLGAGYQLRQWFSTLDPDGDIQWDVASVNSAEFGHSHTGTTLRITRVHIEVLGEYVQPPQIYDVSAESTIAFTSTARNQWAVVSGENTLTFAHEAEGELGYVEGNVESVLTLTDEAFAEVFPAMDAADTLELFEDNVCTIAYTCIAEDTIDLTETASVNSPYYLFAIDTISLTELAEFDDGVSRGRDTISLVEIASASMQANLDASDSISIHEAASYVLITANVDKEYSPFVGGSSDPNAPTPPSTIVPTLTPGSVILEYPFDTPTETLTLRRPLFGNRDRLSNQRINRTTRGNKLIVFADLQWPKVHTLVMDFNPVDEDVAQAYLDFVSASLGREIKLTDWEGREWRGLITNPTDPMTRDHRCNNTISLSFEGELV